MRHTAISRWNRFPYACACVGAMIAGNLPTASATTFLAYIGTYTQQDSHGIYVAEFDADTGKLGTPLLAAESMHPSFLAIHPSGEFLYAVGETDEHDGERAGFVRAFRIDRPSGQLTALNTQTAGGAGPCHLVVDAAGRTLLVANYGGGSVSSIAIGPDGRLGEVISFEQHAGSSQNAQRQQSPHAHSINLDPANRFAFVADLGLDQIIVYRFDAATGKLSRDGAPDPVPVAAGAGPRHFAFHPGGRMAYVINELGSTLVAFDYDPQSGTLTTRQQISTLPDGFDQPSYTAEVVVHPSGRFVYGSNRGHDSIAVFQVGADSGELSRVQVEPTGGKTPRNFVVDPTGKFLLAENQGSNTVVVFRIDPESGRLTPTGESLPVPLPVCIRFLAK